tara:strand:- start:54519 stop:54878 length:360 start_codon:yes stop_codon:yes gene_type:complete
VSKNIQGSFGLVWNGNSLNECAGDFGKYLLYNNPHKTSLYLLCGLPVIIWDQAAISDFIREHDLGIFISSLEELDDTLQNLDPELYQQMVRNVAKVRQKLLGGHFLKTAMDTSLQSLPI